jgi:hypothetical protein
VSLSNDSVLNVLKTQFVCGYRNITGEPYAGKSGKHETDGQAIVTTNGAGPHNVQMFILSEDGVVLHALLGYWDPRDLLWEIRFAQNMSRLWHNSAKSEDVKRREFQLANLLAIRQLPPDMIARSHLQGFDAKKEVKQAFSDFRFKPGDYHPPVRTGKHDELKSTVQVIHERMAQRPFMAYADFDTAEFSDYGKQRYDKKEDKRDVRTGKKKLLGVRGNSD